jgi:carbonic anhydrase/acetyltransferase-like protein (isoleucine patch superfamily)
MTFLHRFELFVIELQVGHKAMLHGCTVGEGSLIGMCATVLNGAVVGKG